MIMSLKAATAVAIIAACLAVAILPASAEFFGWQVANVPYWDVLNVRAYPANGSAILVAYPNGAPLSLTGRCTGGLDLNAINGWPAAQQAAAVRYRWCEVWVDPLGNGNFRSGWVYGKFIRPL